MTIIPSILHPSSSSSSSSHHGLGARSFPREEVPEVADGGGLVLLPRGWVPTHPHAPSPCLTSSSNTSSPSSSTQAEAHGAPPLLGLPVQRLLALEPGGGGAEGGGGGGAGGGGVDQAEEVVVGVELPDVTDGFTGRPLRASWGEREKFDQKL